MVQGEVELKENLGTRRIPKLRMANFPSADEIVRQRPGGSKAFHAAVDHGRFEQPDEDGESPLTLDFLQVNDLIVVDFADNDSRKFHRDGHGRILAHTMGLAYSITKG